MLEEAKIPKRFYGKEFENYVPYEKNKTQYNKIKKYAENFGEHLKDGQWLVIKGGYGLGKTHLSIAVLKTIIFYYASQLVNKNQGLNVTQIRSNGRLNPVKFVRVTDLTQEIKNTFNSNVSEEDVMNSYKFKGFLVIDDLGVENPTQWQLEKLFNLIDYRYSMMKPTLITTNCTLNELADRVGQRIVERITEASDKYIISLEGDSYRMK